MTSHRMITGAIRRGVVAARAWAWTMVLLVSMGLAGMRLTAADITPLFGVTTFAGYGGSGSADGTGEAATFNVPNGVAVDGNGVIYVADTDNSTIRKITTDGVVTTLAGSAGVDGIADGPGISARFNRPFGLVATADGTLFVADTNNHVIRKINPSGEVETLAGSVGEAGLVSGTGTEASFTLPTSLAYDAAADVIYVADTGNKAIRKITPGVVVSTLVEGFENPIAVALSADGSSLFVADSMRHTISRVTVATGVVEVFAGLAGQAGWTDGTGTAARFDQPKGLAFDPEGNLYVAEANGCLIRKITTTGEVTTVAGKYLVPGGADDMGEAARFSNPTGLCHDGSSGRLIVADSLNSRIRTIDTSTAVVANLAGPLSIQGSTDGAGNLARFNSPRGLARDAVGNIYVADRLNHLVRKITPDGVVTTLAGAAGQSGLTNGAATEARFNEPAGVAVTPDGSTIYIADLNNHLVRRITIDDQGAATVATLAGGAGVSGFNDGSGVDARFNQPCDLALDSAGNLFVADYVNNRIRKVTADGQVSTFAPSLSLLGPTGIAIDAEDNVFVADSNSQVIWRITPTAADGNGAETGENITLFAGKLGGNGYVDASTGLDSEFFLPFDISLDGDGHLYVADYGNHVIRRIIVNSDGTAGAVQTLAGTNDSPGFADGVANAARFRNPQGLLAVSASELYIADTENNTIRRAVPVPPPVITSPLTATATVAVAFPGYTIVAEPFDVLFEATGLPPGLALDAASGVISGTPNQAGVFPVLIKAVGLGGDAVETLTITIAKGAATVTLSDLARPYDGTPKSPTVTTSPPSLAYTLTVGGSSVAPSAYGDYPVLVTITDANYQGSAAVTFSITAPVYWNVSAFDAAAGLEIVDIARAPDGTLYFADAYNHVIRRRTPAGVESVFAGGVGDPGYLDGTGTDARFNTPSAIAVDGDGNLFVADTGNHTIRTISPAGIVSFVAGGSDPNLFGGETGIGSQARFYAPADLAIGPTGSLFVADPGNFAVRRIDFGDNGSASVSTLGIAQGIFPGTYVGIAVGLDGAVFVSDREGHQVLRFDDQGDGTYALGYAAGGAGVDDFADGVADVARFNTPCGIVFAADGNLYVADALNHVIRRVSPSGEVFTIAGLALTSGSAIGSGGEARFNQPSALMLDGTGGLLVSDQGNMLLRTLTPPLVVPEITSALSLAMIEGQLFPAYTLTATGSPTAFGATGLPAGVALNATTGALFGTPQHSGIYDADVSVTNALTTVNATLTITVAPPAWADWVADHFTVDEQDDPLVAGPSADPDGDGAPNLLEYHQARDPKGFDGPATEVDVVDGYLVLTYERRRGLDSGVFSAEVSTDLMNWESGPAHTETLDPVFIDARLELVRERSLVPVDLVHKQFMRLRIRE